MRLLLSLLKQGLVDVGAYVCTCNFGGLVLLQLKCQGSQITLVGGALGAVIDQGLLRLSHGSQLVDQIHLFGGKAEACLVAKILHMGQGLRLARILTALLAVEGLG